MKRHLPDTLCTMARPAPFRWLALAVALHLLAGCSGEPSSGPVEVKWDRDQCERCRMVLSDPYHAAQVRQPGANGRSTVYRFDDFGCAVIWLDQQDWRAQPGMEFWVTEHRTGEWIDARNAFFVTGQVTPMEYGLGAQGDPGDGDGNTLNYDQARQRVHETEQRLNAHHHRASGAPVSSPGEGAINR